MNRWRTVLVALALVMLTAAVFEPVRQFDFVQFDDPAYVTENAHVLQGLSIDGIAWAFTTDTAANWHPVTWLSHMLDVQLFGVAPGPLHVTSVVLHAANVLLLFGLLVRLTGARWPSALVAALFAVHPLHVESVAWVAERKDVLSTLFLMLTLWAYAAYARAPGPTRDATAAGASPAGRGYYLLTIACFALGLMAKPMLVTLPFVLLLLDIWPLARLGPARSDTPGVQVSARPSDRVKAGAARASAAMRRSKNRRTTPRPPGPLARARSAWPLVREKLPLFAMAAASAVVTFVVQQRGGAVTGLEADPFALRLQNALVSVVAYLRDMLWPAGLSVFYSFPAAVPGWQVIGALAVLCGMSWLVSRQRRTRPWLLVGWLWYLGTLVPVAGLVRVGLQARADRYTYVPLIGIFIMIAWSAAELVKRRPALRTVVSVAAVGVVLGCAWTARAQTGYWRNSVTLWTRATMVTMGVDEYDAHMALGQTLASQGRLDEARGHFAAAARLRPQSDTARCNLGVVLARSGRIDEAKRELDEALRLNPGNGLARRALEDLERRRF
jgi:protein O-mannosyl-transferase